MPGIAVRIQGAALVAQSETLNNQYRELVTRKSQLNLAVFR